MWEGWGVQVLAPPFGGEKGKMSNIDLAVIKHIAGRVKLPENFGVDVGSDELPWVQIKCFRPDIRDGRLCWGYGGKRYIGPNYTLDSIVRTIFAAYAAYADHECRETFLFDGARVFGPHIAVKALQQVADQLS